MSRNSKYRETRKEAIDLWQNTTSWIVSVSKAEETPKRKANKCKVNARIRGVRSGCLKNNAERPRRKASRGNPHCFCASNLFISYAELVHLSNYTLWISNSFLRVWLFNSVTKIFKMPADDSLHRTRLLE